MKFQFGPKLRSGGFTVIPARHVMDMSRGMSTITPAVRVEIKEHQFDSETPAMIAQYKAYADFMTQAGHETKWEDVQERVNTFLIEHGDWARADGRGIFFGNLDTLTKIKMQASHEQKRCTFEQDAGDGNLVMCNEFVADPTKEFCDAHQKLVDEALAAMAGRGEIGGDENEQTQEPQPAAQ